MNKLLVIENEQSDFIKVKNIFNDCWTVFPTNHEDIDYMDNDKIVSHIKNAITNDGISSIILDISLQGYEDKEGFKIIDEIRKIDDLKYKIIPIYCYSNHGNDKDFISEAFKAGATNIFSKGNIEDKNSDEISFLKSSLTALSFIYTSIRGYPLNMNEVIEQMKQNTQLLQKIDGTTTTNLNAILQLSKYENICAITEINDVNRKSIEDAIGGQEALNNLLQTKWFAENKEQQEQLIDNIADIFSNIPVLSSFAAILKGITLISKSIK